MEIGTFRSGVTMLNLLFLLLYGSHIVFNDDIRLLLCPLAGKNLLLNIEPQSLDVL